MKKYCLSLLLSVLFSGSFIGQNQENKHVIYDIQRNSIYIELGGLGAIVSINYERLVPLGSKTGLGFRVGAGTAGSADTATSDIAYTAVAEINFLYGKSKHYLEPGIGFANAFVASDTEQWVSIKLGYRYQAPKGFLFKIAPMYIYNFEKQTGNNDVFGGIWLGASFGYSF